MNEKELLKKLYIDEKKSLREIAEMFKTTKVTVRNRLSKYGITIRPRGRDLKAFKLKEGD
jgi:DNA-binding Lrp family transcriptional regulator